MTDAVPAYLPALMSGKPIMAQAYNPRTGAAVTQLAPLKLEPRTYTAPGVDIYALLPALDGWRGPYGVDWKWFDGEIEIANGHVDDSVMLRFQGSLHLSWSLYREEWMPLYTRLLNEKYRPEAP